MSIYKKISDIPQKITHEYQDTFRVYSTKRKRGLSDSEKLIAICIIGSFIVSAGVSTLITYFILRHNL